MSSSDGLVQASRAVADSGRPCVSYSVFRKAPPYYIQAERLARTTPQPWLRWQYSQAEWEGFAQQQQADLTEGSKQIALGSAIFAAVLVAGGFIWHSIDEYAREGPLTLAMCGVIPFIAIMIMLLLLAFTGSPHSAERKAGPYVATVNPLWVQQGQSSVLLFGEHTFCTRVEVDPRTTPAQLRFEVCQVGHGTYTPFLAVVPIPPGHEAAARALVARFQHEIFDAPASEPTPSPPTPSQWIAPPRRVKVRPPPRHQRR